MPKLVSIAGPLRGAAFPLTERDGDSFSIGRAVGNSLCIEDPSVSRHHCVVARTGDHFTITDRGSVNRTYVNGLPLQEHTLRSGDEIKIGESLFLFLADGEEHAAAEEADAASQSIHQATTVMIPVLKQPPAQPPAPTRAAPPNASHLNALLQLGEAAAGTAGLDELQRHVMESLSLALPVEHALLILAASGPAEAASVYSWRRNSGDRDMPLEASEVIDRMMRSPEGILWNRPRKRVAHKPAELAIGPAVSALIAVPLVAFERFIGALAVTSSSPATSFDDEHLRFMQKFAGIVAALLEHALSAKDQENEARLRRAESNLEHNMVGESPRMRKIYETIAKVAPTDSTVLIRGESGTGKELAARAIHRNSRRSDKPFVAINCAALTETLLESELFGHEKGAFTGAVVQKRGKLEEAAGGTVFFDEIGEMSFQLQAKLLRVLQEREFERVGGTRSIKADVRIIAATNRDLEEAIRRGAFRSDLYYRLNVVSMTMPALRERAEDIEILANHFAQKHSRKLKKWIAGISRPAYGHLRSYDWPGNVRELENAIERALVLGSTDMIQSEDLPESVIEANSSAEDLATGSFHTTVLEAKKRLIIETLQKTKGNYLEAARLLGLHPNSLHRMIRQLNLKVQSAG